MIQYSGNDFNKKKWSKDKEDILRKVAQLRTLAAQVRGLFIFSPTTDKAMKSYGMAKHSCEGMRWILNEIRSTGLPVFCTEKMVLQSLPHRVADKYHITKSEEAEDLLSEYFANAMRMLRHVAFDPDWMHDYHLSAADMLIAHSDGSVVTYSNDGLLALAVERQITAPSALGAVRVGAGSAGAAASEPGRQILSGASSAGAAGSFPGGIGSADLTSSITAMAISAPAAGGCGVGSANAAPPTPEKQSCTPSRANPSTHSRGWHGTTPGALSTVVAPSMRLLRDMRAVMDLRRLWKTPAENSARSFGPRPLPT